MSCSTTCQGHPVLSRKSTRLATGSPFAVAAWPLDAHGDIDRARVLFLLSAAFVGPAEKLVLFPVWWSGPWMYCAYVKHLFLWLKRPGVWSGVSSQPKDNRELKQAS